MKSAIKNNIAKNIYVFEKSKKNKKIIKKINNKIKFIDNLNNSLFDMNFIIVCTPMSEYKNIFNKLNKLVQSDVVITEVGSTKRNLLKFTKNRNVILSHPIAGSEVSGPNYGDKELFNKKWCIVINKGEKKKINLVKRFWKKMDQKLL